MPGNVDFAPFFETYKSAVLAKDVDALNALYGEDVIAFDLWGDWSLAGEGWREMNRAWLTSLGDESVVVDFDDIEIFPWRRRRRRDGDDRVQGGLGKRRDLARDAKSADLVGETDRRRLENRSSTYVDTDRPRHDGAEIPSLNGGAAALAGQGEHSNPPDGRRAGCTNFSHPAGIADRAMPTLTRLIVAIVILAGAAYGGMLALVMLEKPTQREIVVPIVLPSHAPSPAPAK